MSADELDVLNNLVAAGLGSDDFKITDELFRGYQLMPPLNIEIVGGEHIGIRGSKLVPSTFELTEISSNSNREEDGSTKDMVNLNIIMPKKSGARSSTASSATPSSS